MVYRHLRSALALVALYGCTNQDFSVVQIDYVERECERCSNDECPEAIAACVGDEKCAPILDCVAACSLDHPGCRYDCITARELPITWLALDDCRHDTCANTCIGARADDLSVQDAEACGVCLEERCASEAVACFESASCDPAFACLARCTNPEECATRCPLTWGAFDEASCTVIQPPEVAPVVACLRNSCRVECGFGEQFACVDQFDYERFASSFRASFDAQRWPGTDPMPGVELRVCPVEEACSTSTALTNAEGQACLDYPTMSRNGFTGIVEATGPGLIPMIFDFSFPLGSPTDAISNTVFVAEEVYPAIELALGITISPDKGHLYAQMFDCTAQASPGVSFAIGGRVPDAYTVFGQLDPAASETSIDGIGISFNLDPGPVDIVARHGGEVVGCMTSVVRPGWLTVAFIYPHGLGDAACIE